MHEPRFGVKHPLTSSREGCKGLLDQVQATVLTQDLLPADWPRLTGGLPGGGFLASSSLSMRLISCSAELGSMAKEWQRCFDQPFHEVRVAWFWVDCCSLRLWIFCLNCNDAALGLTIGPLTIES